MTLKTQWLGSFTLKGHGLYHRGGVTWGLISDHARREGKFHKYIF